MTTSGDYEPKTIRMVYLAGPIDLSGESGPAEREQVALTLKKSGISSYHPEKAFTWAGVNGERIIDINMEALLCCDAMLLCWDGVTPTVGSFRELQFCIENGIPVVVLLDAAVNPLKIVYLSDVTVVTSVQDFLKWAELTDQGAEPHDIRLGCSVFEKRLERAPSEEQKTADSMGAIPVQESHQAGS